MIAVAAALRIVLDVFVFRLKKLEMANMGAAVAIMVALHLEISDIAVRSFFALQLNLLAYLTNDYLDVDRDLKAGREPTKTHFLAGHRRSALFAQWGLFALLIVIAAVYDWGLLIPAIFGAGICWLYTAKLKHMPLWDLVAMTAWGIAMTAVAFPASNSLGWLIVLQLGLFSTCFESIQVLRDHDEDKAAGVVTTAVLLGPRRTLLLARSCMVIAAVYAFLLLHVGVGGWLLAAVLLPCPLDRVSRYWNQVKMVQGLGLATILASVWFHSQPSGWLSP